MTALPHYHIVGIAGVGMSALAEYLLLAGYHVSGSDRFYDTGQELEILQTLRAMGAQLVPQDGTGITPQTRAVIVSSAIEPDNPEIQQASQLNVPLLHRTQLIHQLSNDKKIIGIAGTSGKSTTTAMVGWILEQTGLDPHVINGAPLVDWASPERIGSSRLGESSWMVLELDESDRSLLRFQPHTALITNISADHFTLEESQRLFQQFSSQVTHTLLTGSQCPQAHTLFPAATKVPNEPIPCPIPGSHNQENANGAIALCQALGIERPEATKALQTFSGVQRRFEQIGVKKEVRYIDDYAHNPAKIHAALITAQNLAPTVIAYWRPHGFGPLKKMGDELRTMLCQTLRPQDRFYVLPVFYAGGTTTEQINTEAWLSEAPCPNIIPVRNYQELTSKLNPKPKDIVLGLGARDPDIRRFLQQCVTA